MIVTLEGVQGSGKSMTSVALIYADFVESKRRVLANCNLNFEHEKFDLDYFLEHLSDDKMANCSHLLDEGYLFMDSRTTASKLNKLFSYYLVQTRKRDVTVYICTHHIENLDKRLRRAADIRGNCHYLKEEPCRLCHGTGCIVESKKEDKRLALCESGKGFIPVKVRKTSTWKGAAQTEIEFLTHVDDSKGSRAVVPSSRVHLKKDVEPSTWLTYFPKDPEPDSSEGDMCPRCLGYGITGWATTRFLDNRTGGHRKIRVFGPAVFPLYQTDERIPFTKKQMDVTADEL